MENWLYFRTVASLSNDNGIVSSVNDFSSMCIPGSAVVSISPSSDTRLLISIKNIRLDDQQAGGTPGFEQYDYLYLDCTQYKLKDVSEAIFDAIAGNGKQGFIVVGDDVTGEYLHPDIVGVGILVAYGVEKGIGYHTMQALSKIDAGGDAASTTAGEVGRAVASLPFSLPTGSVILEASIRPLNSTSMSDIGNASVNLKYHTAAVADNAATAGTVLIGENAGDSLAQKAVVTMTFAGALVTSNTIDMNIDGVALAQQTFSTDSDTTMAAIAAAIQALAQIETATVTDAGSNDRIIVITAATAGVDLDFSDITVASGSSQTTATVANTTQPFALGSCIPNSNLNIGSGDTASQIVTSGTSTPIALAAQTYFHLNATEDMSSATDSEAFVVSTIKWFGDSCTLINVG